MIWDGIVTNDTDILPFAYGLEQDTNVKNKRDKSVLCKNKQ